MFSLSPTQQSVQCMECGRFRVDGVWKHLDRVPRIISHTFCPDCTPLVLQELQMERQFATWSYEQQVNSLAQNLQRRPMDRKALRERLRELRVEDSLTRARLEEAVSSLLVDKVCPYCHLEIPPGAPTTLKAGYTLHQECASRLEDSLQLLERLPPTEIRHLDAHMDGTHVPHSVREGVRRELEGR